MGLLCPPYPAGSSADQLELSPISDLQGIKLLLKFSEAPARWPKLSHCELDVLGERTFKDERDEKGKRTYLALLFYERGEHEGVLCI